MPRAFNEQERETIRAALLDHGGKHFARQGLRKTSVEELAVAAGISKGAFYLFFESKEDLYFTLLEMYEARYRGELLAQIARRDLPARARMAALLERALEAWKEASLFARFSRAEYELLLRRLPAERVTAHIAQDEAFAESFAAAWAAEGVTLAAPPRLVAGLIRALFFVSMHEDDFGSDAYPEVIGDLVTILAARLIDGLRQDS